MPTAPKRLCSGSPRCRALVSGRGPCRDCARKRGSRHARGYDAAWVCLTRRFWRIPSNRWCVCCAAGGVRTRATEADHIVPFVGLDDPRRLDLTNLQPLCGTCHRRKTGAQSAIVWNGEMDRRGTCPSLIDGAVARPSTLAPGLVSTIGSSSKEGE